jgi:hypothetical protein
VEIIFQELLFQSRLQLQLYNTILLLSTIPFPKEETHTTTTRMELRTDSSTDMRSMSIIMLTTKTITTSLLHPARLIYSLFSFSASQQQQQQQKFQQQQYYQFTNKRRLHNQTGTSLQGKSTLTGLQTVSSISSLPKEDNRA